jgi:uncharacterized protein YlzI (FlbEa/FlbD family)
MARLAAIENVRQNPSDQPRTVHVNPAHIVSVEGIPGGTKIVLSVGTIYLSQAPFDQVVDAINQAWV